MNRRLYRCRHDKRLAGVSSGLAEYFDVDVSLVRVLWVLSIFFGGLGILAYIVLAIVVPIEPETIEAPEAGTTATAVEPRAHAGWSVADEAHRHRTSGSGMGANFFGMILILFGALALIDGYLPGWADNGRFLWPAFILGVGALLVVTAVRRRPEER